jgi:hypothetical protein
MRNPDWFKVGLKRGKEKEILLASDNKHSVTCRYQVFLPPEA